MHNRRTWKWYLLVLAGSLVAAGCGQGPENDGPADQANRTEPLPGLPVADPPMDRAALLIEVAKAASAAALGRNDANEKSGLDGKMFEVRIRFGCPSPNEPDRTDQDQVRARSTFAEPFSVGFEEASRRLSIRAAPDLTMTDWPADEAIEAVEGFWMYRPWLLTDGCPQSPPPSEPEAPNLPSDLLPGQGQRVGLAQFFTSLDARTARRKDRPYEVTKTLPENGAPSTAGYNLVLSGRLREAPDGKVISCSVISANQPPKCIVASEFDRVRIEDASSKEILAEWSN